MWARKTKGEGVGSLKGGVLERMGSLKGWGP